MQVGIRELKAHLSELVDHAARGEVIVVTERGKPVAQLSPHHPTELPARLTELVRQGAVILASKPLVLPRRGARMHAGHSLGDVVIEERRNDRLLR